MSLKSLEKVKLEKFLEMGGGYVCDFSNRTFGEFIAETANIDIYDKHMGFGGSKANRLREFWNKQPNQIVSKVLDELLDYWRSQLTSGTLYGHQPLNEGLYNECKAIAKRLAADHPVEDADALTPNSSEKDFHLLAQSIKESMSRGNFELDRLHTFVVKYLRTLCQAHGTAFDKKTPLNALMGSYVKSLRDKQLVESGMTQEILKGSIRVLEAFDAVRNNQTFAHDNPILNPEESRLIFSHVSSLIRFIETLEKKRPGSARRSFDSSKLKLSNAFTEEEIDAAFDAAVQLELDKHSEK